MGCAVGKDEIQGDKKAQRTAATTSTGASGGTSAGAPTPHSSPKPQPASDSSPRPLNIGSGERNTKLLLNGRYGVLLTGLSGQLY